MNQPNDDPPGMAVAERQGDCAHCRSSELFRVLAHRLESRGLDARLVDYPGDTTEERVEEMVITNPAARERGEIRVGDDGSVTWEYFGKLDEAGTSRILDEITNALRAPGILLRRIRP